MEGVALSEDMISPYSGDLFHEVGLFLMPFLRNRFLFFFFFLFFDVRNELSKKCPMGVPLFTHNQFLQISINVRKK